VTFSASPVIRASEISQYVFCRRAWWLGAVKGYRPINQAALAAGEEYHARHGHMVAVSLRWRRAGYVLLGLGVLLGIGLTVYWVGVGL
jgi:CRISPR/Cas system-associated exonuclease Cas4 (RecB family)